MLRYKHTRIGFVFLATVIFLLNACTYSMSVNGDVGTGRVDSDHYNILRSGGALGFGLLGVPATADLRFSHEADMGGSGALAKRFQQNETMADLNVWWPNSTWQPMAHIGSFSNQFNGLKGSSASSIDYAKRELGIGVRHRSQLDTAGNCNIGYGYAIEAFASRGSGSAGGGDKHVIESFGVRVSGFVDSGSYAGVLPWAGGVTCLPAH